MERRKGKGKSKEGSNMSIKTYIYYYRLRPPSPGCQPKKGLLKTSNDAITRHNREYWGYAEYDRELSDKELFDYDLDK